MGELDPGIRQEDRKRAELISRISKWHGVGRLLTPIEWETTDTHAASIGWTRAEADPHWYLKGPLANATLLYRKAMVLEVDGDEIREMEVKYEGNLAAAFRVGETAVVAARFSRKEGVANAVARFRVGGEDLDATVGVLADKMFIGAEHVIERGFDIPIGDARGLYPEATPV